MQRRSRRRLWGGGNRRVVLVKRVCAQAGAGPQGAQPPPGRSTGERGGARAAKGGPPLDPLLRTLEVGQPLWEEASVALLADEPQNEQEEVDHVQVEVQRREHGLVHGNGHRVLAGGQELQVVDCFFSLVMCVRGGGGVMGGGPYTRGILAPGLVVAAAGGATKSLPHLATALHHVLPVPSLPSPPPLLLPLPACHSHRCSSKRPARRRRR